MSLYTKNGDQGMTGLLSNNQVKKDNPYITFNGHVDELTSQLGLVKVMADDDLKKEIEVIQNQLIEIMSYAAREFKEGSEYKEEVAFFEEKIDAYSAMYPKQTDFITPGDNELSARIDLARAIVRRTERSLSSIHRINGVPSDVLKYFNRFSDYLYAMARMISFRKKVIDLLGSQVVITKDNLNIQKQVMNLTLAKEIVSKTEEFAIEKEVQVVICIAGNEGLPVLVQKMDDAFPVSFRLAMKKAYTSAVLKMPTHELAQLTKEGGEFYGLQDMLDEEIVTLGGGYPIYDGNKLIGSIGVSGSTVDNDIEVARKGALIIERINL